MADQPQANDPVPGSPAVRPAVKPVQPAPTPAGKATGAATAPAAAVSAATAAAAQAASAAPAARGAAPRAARAGTKPAGVAIQVEEEVPTLWGSIQGTLRQTPSWLTSMVVHMVLLVILFAIPMKSAIEERSQLVVDTLDPKEIVEELQEEPLEEVELMNADITEAVETESAQAIEIAEEPEPVVSSDIVLEEVSDRAVLMDSLMESSGSSMSGELGNRGSAEGRAAGVAMSGGSAGSEDAVQKALAWLAKVQLRDGSWNFDHRLSGTIQGQADHPGSLKEARFAATGMGLLPFLGAGMTHKEGKYKENVQASLLWIGQNMKGGSMYEGGGSLYSHGICAIALCEAYAMTNDKRLFDPAQAAINFTCSAQDPVLGGWQYTPRSGSDTSGMGWQLMALKSGHMGYLTVPPATINNAAKFLDSVQVDDGSAYGYASPGVGQATTAIGLLCRMYMGWKKDNPALKRGVELISGWGPSMAAGNPPTANMYFNYYATQVMHHWEGDLWTKWNAGPNGTDGMRDFLVNTQAKGNKKTEGSWYLTGDHGSDMGGRLYCTAMAAMTLEVYYRHSPIYRKSSTEDDFEE